MCSRLTESLECLLAPAPTRGNPSSITGDHTNAHTHTHRHTTHTQDPHTQTPTPTRARTHTPTHARASSAPCLSQTLKAVHARPATRALARRRPALGVALGPLAPARGALPLSHQIAASGPIGRGSDAVRKWFGRGVGPPACSVAMRCARNVWATALRHCGHCGHCATALQAVEERLAEAHARSLFPDMVGGGKVRRRSTLRSTRHSTQHAVVDRSIDLSI